MTEQDLANQVIESMDYCKVMEYATSMLCDTYRDNPEQFHQERAEIGRAKGAVDGQRHKYIVESIGLKIVSAKGRAGPNHYTTVVWAVSEADARSSEKKRLLNLHGNVSVKILSAELDPHCR